MTIDPAVNQLAQQVLTAPQYAAWHLEAQGCSQRQIALHLDITRSAVVARLDNAYLKLKRAGVKQTPAGIYYLEETA